MKHVLDSLTEFLRAHLNDSLEKVSPELHVSPGFMSLTRSFVKIFGLCEDYPKGLGKVFHQWTMYNHSSEILFHLERAAADGRQDVSSMDEILIFWNINYCVEFLNEMISYCGKSENILARNLMILLSSVEIIAVSWL